MSHLYNLEPQPTAKVLLQTSAGDLELELFAKQTPLASRNFLQLCLDGYYDNTIFHRLVPGFIIQGGDPTGTGSGGESSYNNGEPFADEFHSRLKFNRRGLLGMANTGKKDDNGSQFFLTLDNTPELTNKNTMFGRIQGDTIYNLMEMGKAELVEGSEDRPLYPVKIIKIEILVNPFSDMVKRERVAQRSADEIKLKKKKAPKRKAGKNILSFGGDDEEEEEETPAVKKPKFNTALVSAGYEKSVKPANTPTLKSPTSIQTLPPSTVGTTRIPSTSTKTPQTAEKKDTRTDKNNELSRSLSPHSNKLPLVNGKPSSKLSSQSTDSEDEEADDNDDDYSNRIRKDDFEKTKAQIEALKASMKRNTTSSASTEKPKSALEAMIPATSTRGRKRRPDGDAGSSSDMDLFKAFKAKLKAAPAESLQNVPDLPHTHAASVAPGDHGAAPGNDDDDEEAIYCDLHFVPNCQSCNAWDKQDQAEEDENPNDLGWLSHALTAEKDRLGKDLEWKRKNEEELVVIDPREKAKELKEKQPRRRDHHDKDPLERMRNHSSGHHRPHKSEHRNSRI
jgi:peptidyl-prolyl cis-trans isomerase SDCCAG10